MRAVVKMYVRLTAEERYFLEAEMNTLLGNLRQGIL